MEACNLHWGKSYSAVLNFDLIYAKKKKKVSCFLVTSGFSVDGSEAFYNLFAYFINKKVLNSSIFKNNKCQYLGADITLHALKYIRHFDWEIFDSK